MTDDELKDVFAGQFVAGVAGTARVRGTRTEELKQLAKEAYDVAEALVAERKARILKRQGSAE
jgi:hypothetical protein